MSDQNRQQNLDGGDEIWGYRSMGTAFLSLQGATRRVADGSHTPLPQDSILAACRWSYSTEAGGLFSWFRSKVPPINAARYLIVGRHINGARGGPSGG